MAVCVPPAEEVVQQSVQQEHQLTVAIHSADSAQHYSATVAVSFVTFAQDNTAV
jgi:hypothetical protein